MKKHFKIIKECIGSNDGLCESCYGTGYMEDGWDCQECNGTGQGPILWSQEFVFWSYRWYCIFKYYSASNKLWCRRT
ncbi:hypothetical protein EXQ38_01520 [Clostridium botulinum]|nr:hypothetical protein [Clostridium botulinum]